jgi:hypothetical protein
LGCVQQVDLGVSEEKKTKKNYARRRAEVSAALVPALSRCATTCAHPGIPAGDRSQGRHHHHNHMTGLATGPVNAAFGRMSVVDVAG